MQADALALPFSDQHFDSSVSVTALCFIDDWQRAWREILRVTRSRFVIALLNHNSYLWHEKGQQGGSVAYQGAYWHSIDELRAALADLPVQEVRYAESRLSNALDWGGFLVVSGTKANPA